MDSEDFLANLDNIWRVCFFVTRNAGSHLQVSGELAETDESWTPAPPPPKTQPQQLATARRGRGELAFGPPLLRKHSPSS